MSRALNIYHFLIGLNAELERRGTAIGRVERLDFSAIEDDVPLEPLPAGRLDVIDLQTTIELHTPAYTMLLADRPGFLAPDQLAATGREDRPLCRTHHRAGAASGDGVNGLSTERLHIFLRELKARQAETASARDNAV